MYKLSSLCSSRLQSGNSKQKKMNNLVDMRGNFPLSSIGRKDNGPR